MNYEKDIKIDESALDVEWLGHAGLAIKWGKALADKEKELALAEEDFEVFKAELTDYVNNNTEEALGKGVKPTVNNVESFIIQDKKYRERKKTIIDLKHEVSILKVASIQVSTARKSALENLVKLHGQNYFAGPSMPRDLSYEVQQKEKQKKTDIGVAGKMKRIKK